MFMIRTWSRTSRRGVLITRSQWAFALVLVVASEDFDVVGVEDGVERAGMRGVTVADEES